MIEKLISDITNLNSHTDMVLKINEIIEVVNKLEKEQAELSKQMDIYPDFDD